SSFFEILRTFAFEISVGNINSIVTMVAVFTTAIAFAVRRYYPQIPYMIVAVVGGTLFGSALQWLFGERLGELPKLGAISGALPPFSTPDLSLDSIRQTVPIAVGMTILGLTEALSIARAIAVRSGQRIEANQEFVGQGLSNLA